MTEARRSVKDTWFNLAVSATHSEQTTSLPPLQNKTWNECLDLMLCCFVILELNLVFQCNVRLVTRTKSQCFCFLFLIFFLNIMIQLSSGSNWRDNFSVTHCNSACTISPANDKML